MVKLTLADGPEAELVSERVIRIRRASTSDGNPAAKTLINWVEIMLVKELPDFVAQAVSEELMSVGETRLGKLSLLDNTPVWFRGTQAKGPLRIRPHEKKEGYNSALEIAGQRQLVRQTHDQVQAEVRAVGGDPLPIPIDSFLSTTIDYLSNLGGLAKQRTWDE